MSTVHFLGFNREREMLKKRGVDISLLPRRTTNIIERFSESMAVSSRTSTHQNNHCNGIGLIDIDGQ